MYINNLNLDHLIPNAIFGCVTQLLCLFNVLTDDIVFYITRVAFLVVQKPNERIKFSFKINSL